MRSAFTNDRQVRQMADVHRLGDIERPEVDEHLAPMRHGRGAQARIGGDEVGALAERSIGQHEIQEAGAGDVERLQPCVVGQAGGDPGRHVARIGLDLLGHSQGAVALEIGEVGPAYDQPRRPKPDERLLVVKGAS